MPFTALVAMPHVASVPRSIAFYGQLGFTVENTFTPPGVSEPTWAWLKSNGAHLMVSRGTLSVVADEQGVTFYLYCEDVPAMKLMLERDGVAAGPITHPFYAPRGEFRIVDPDGYALMITHT